MSGRTRQLRRFAENVSGGHEVAGDVPSRSRPQEELEGERTAQELRLYRMLTDLVLAGVAHVSVDAIRLYELAGLQRLPEAEQTPDVASQEVTTSAMRPSLPEPSVALNFMYPLLSQGMLAYMNGVRDRVVAEAAAAAPLPYPGVWERTTLSAEETVRFADSSGKLPDGMVAGDLFNDPTQYVPTSGSEVKTRRTLDPEPSNLPTTPLFPVDPQDMKPRPHQSSDELGNPPVQIFRPIELPPNT